MALRVESASRCSKLRGVLRHRPLEHATPASTPIALLPRFSVFASQSSPRALTANREMLGTSHGTEVATLLRDSCRQPPPPWRRLESADGVSGENVDAKHRYGSGVRYDLSRPASSNGKLPGRAHPRRSRRRFILVWTNSGDHPRGSGSCADEAIGGCSRLQRQDDLDGATSIALTHNETPARARRGRYVRDHPGEAARRRAYHPTFGVAALAASPDHSPPCPAGTVSWFLVRARAPARWRRRERPYRV